jgi:hypothetical protein
MHTKRHTTDRRGNPCLEQEPGQGRSLNLGYLLPSPARQLTVLRGYRVERLAGALGFEPRLPVPETGALPLRHAPIPLHDQRKGLAQTHSLSSYH